MRTVGLRELKNRLGTYVGHVRRGETIAISDRGRVVAELTPPSAADGAEAALEEMARRGEAIVGMRVAAAKRAAFYRPASRPMLKGTTAQALLDAERSE